MPVEFDKKSEAEVSKWERSMLTPPTPLCAEYSDKHKKKLKKE